MNKRETPATQRPHLLSPAGDAAIAELLTRQPLLAFDFDGTLAPIVAVPAEAASAAVSVLADAVIEDAGHLRAVDVVRLGELLGAEERAEVGGDLILEAHDAALATPGPAPS